MEKAGLFSCGNAHTLIEASKELEKHVSSMEETATDVTGPV